LNEKSFSGVINLNNTVYLNTLALLFKKKNSNGSNDYFTNDYKIEFKIKVKLNNNSNDNNMYNIYNFIDYYLFACLLFIYLHILFIIHKYIYIIIYS